MAINGLNTLGLYFGNVFLLRNILSQEYIFVFNFNSNEINFISERTSREMYCGILLKQTIFALLLYFSN